MVGPREPPFTNQEENGWLPTSIGVTGIHWVRFEHIFCGDPTQPPGVRRTRCRETDAVGADGSGRSKAAPDFGSGITMPAPASAACFRWGQVVAKTTLEHPGFHKALCQQRPAILQMVHILDKLIGDWSHS